MNERARQSTSNADVPFGTRLRRARESAGLTQEALAERAGLTPNSVGALERGEHRHPYPATVRALAEALGLTELERAALARSVPMRNRTTGGSASHVAEVPIPLSPLIGREREVASVTGLLQTDGIRLVTLSGPGGVGKTRLALHVAAELKSVFRDGIVFVSLASIRDPALVAPEIARALSLGEDVARSPEAGVTDALRSQHLLLVLDNFEHLPDAAPFVTHLLVRCPRLIVLVTSRTPLRLDGERELPVPPLEVPDPERLADSDELAGVAAVQLFVERAREVDPTFTLTPTNSAAVAAICLRLDGLPLAIELAAARSRLLPPAALLPRLARRLPLLTGGRRDAPARHQTMRSAIAWSHDLLSPEEQSLFRCLAIFAGGCTLEAAEIVCGPFGNEPVVDGISALIEHGLLYRIDGPDGEPRVAMLETIREYALEQLAESGDEHAVSAAHPAWFLGLAERAAPFWFTPAQAEWGDRLEAEHDNLRAALSRSTVLGRGDVALRLAGRLWPFWFIRGHHTEGRAWLEQMLESRNDSRTIDHVRVLTGAACFARCQGDMHRSTRLGEEALTIAKAIGAGGGIDAAHALIGLALTAATQGDHAQAAVLNDQVLAILRAHDSTDPSAGPVTSVIISNLAGSALEEGNDARAAELAALALEHQRESGFTWAAADSLNILASIALRNGDAGRAASLWSESLAFIRDHRDPQQVIWPLDQLALLAADRGHCITAARLLGAADLLYEQLGWQADQDGDSNRRSRVEAIKRLAGTDQYHAAWYTGRSLPLADVISEALAIADIIAAGTSVGIDLPPATM
jgi:predicted ATPase/transcriptional regulator with XRE-family HTH domain